MGQIIETQGGWTFETLLAHLTALIEANDERYQQRFLDAQTAVNTAMSAAEKAVSAALSAAKEAVIKAETASDKRFEGVNEFRATLSDQQRTLMPRAEAELRLNALSAQVEAIQKIMGERQGERRGGVEMRAYISYSTRTMKPDDWDRLKYFKPAEFKNPDKMGFEFMLWLDKLRHLAGVPMLITSSYRSPVYNAQVGGAKHSAHCDIPCDAVDIGMTPRASDPNWNFSRFRIVSTAISLGCKRIGTYANGSLHLDMSHARRPAPRMWRVVGAE